MLFPASKSKSVALSTAGTPVPVLVKLSAVIVPFGASMSAVTLNVPVTSKLPVNVVGPTPTLG